MKNPKVSVVIPAYNHEKYVGEAVQSVLDQTFQDFELIIINDGSTDHTEAEILRFNDDRIRYYSQENRGLSATLNRGIELARAEYFSFLPSDDLFYRDKLEIQLEAFQATHHDLGIIFSKQTVVDASGSELLGDPIIDWFNVPYRTKEEIFPALFERNFLPAPTMMCRKECFDRVGGFDESLYYCQDYDMWLRILKFYDIRILEKALLKYRWHGENLTYTKTERADFERAVLLLRSIKNLEISDIFPGLKGLEKSEVPEKYSSSYRALAHHILKSGLIELVPIAYSWMEEVRKLEPSFEIEVEMEKLISERPYFLDLRDNRLGRLTNEMSELRFKLARFDQWRVVLEEQSKKIEKREEALEKEVKEIKRREEEFEKREDALKEKEETFEKEKLRVTEQEKIIAQSMLQIKEKEKLRVNEQEKIIAQSMLQIKEKESYLERWQSELLMAQAKWDRFARKPYILALRFFYKILKRVWKLLPEGVRRPIRDRLGGSLSSPKSKTHEIEVKVGDRNQVEWTAQPQPFLTPLPTEIRIRVSLGMIKQPRVSVVLPVYNQSHLIEEAIKSVLNQTYPNLELIIVNDGSTDRVNEILPRYGFHDKVKILNQENQGLPRALSNGFRHATGSFFAWTSADNLMLPNQVETLVDFLMRRPDVDMVYSNVEIIDENGSPFLHSNYRVHNQYPPGSNQIYLPYEVETLGSIEDNFINASFLYRADAGKVLGEYDPCLLGTEDYDYWLRMNSLFTVKHLDSNEILYRYRVHSDSLSDKYGESDIFENAKILINYHRERESYYNRKFDVVFLGNRIQNSEERSYRFALELRNQGHHVLWGILDSGRAGEVVRRDGMVEIFIGKGEPAKIKENIFKHKQHDKTLIILTAPFKRTILEPLKGEDIFIYYDLNRNEDVGAALLEFVDAISSRSQSLLSKTKERFKAKSYYIRNGFHDERILRKARDNHYKLFGFSLNREKILAYYGPLRKDFLDQELFSELTKGKRDWNFLLIGEPGQVDEELISELSKSDNVYFLEEKRSDNNGNLYQILSNISAIWAPVKFDEEYEELIQRLIEIASLSGRPLIAPDGLNFSDIPFVFSFKDAKECAGLLDVVTQSRIDEEIFDRWIARNSWKEKANWFTAIANNKLFYRKTREPIKKDRKLLDRPPTVCGPNGGKVNVLIQVRSLDKGGLEEVISNLVCHFDYKKLNTLILCEEKGGRIADQCKDLGIMVKIPGKEKEEEYKEIIKKYSIKVVNPHHATFGMKIAHEMGIPVIPVLHNTFVWFDDQEIADFKSCDQYVSKYIAVSENVARYSIEKFGIPREKVQVISNGLDMLKHQAMMKKGKAISRASLGIGEQDFLLLNIASYDGRKGHHALLSALKRVKDGYSGMKVLCVGNIADPDYYARLKKRISEEGLEKDVVLHDYVQDVSSLYRVADAFVLPSLIEGWSISVMEAMFYGLPLILTDVGNNGEILKKTGNGILIPTSYGDILRLDQRNLGRYCSEEEPANTEALAKAMLDFCTRKDHWKEKGQQGKEAVRNFYNIDDAAKAYENVFLQMAKKR